MWSPSPGPRGFRCSPLDGLQRTSGPDFRGALPVLARPALCEMKPARLPSPVLLHFHRDKRSFAGASDSGAKGEAESAQAESLP